MGSETGGRKCEAWSRFCARKRSLATGAYHAADAQWSRHGKSLPAPPAKTLRARVAGRDGPRFRRSGVSEMAQKTREGEKPKRRTVRAARAINAERSTSN